MKVLSKILIPVALSMLIVGCGGGGDNNSTASTTQDGNISVNNGTSSQTGNGKITVYPKKRDVTSLVAEARVYDPSGINKITLYCIDAYKYYEENKLVIIGKSTKVFNAASTKVEFYQHTFKNLGSGKSYVLKAVAETESNVISQLTTTATYPKPINYSNSEVPVNTAPYNVLHSTKHHYVFCLAHPANVKKVRIKEYDGDLDTMNVNLHKADHSGFVQIGTNVLLSGNNVQKTHILSVNGSSYLTGCISIDVAGNAGGLWQIDEIVVNPK